MGRSITDHINVIPALLFCSLHLLKERIESIKNLLNMNYSCFDGFNGDHRIEHILKDEAAPSKDPLRILMICSRLQ